MIPCPAQFLPSWVRPYIGRHVGIIQDISLSMPTPGDVPVYCCAARSADTGVLTRQGCWTPQSGGVGTTPESAVQSAVGEAVERYCAAFERTSVVDTYHSLKRSASLIRPSQLSGFSPEQLKPHGLSVVDVDAHSLRWYEGTSLDGKRPIYMPAAWVTMPYGGTDFQTAGNTTGLACGQDLSCATFNAVMEIIERDAYVHTWLFRGRPPRVSVENTLFGEALASLVPFERWQVTIYDLTGELGVPVFLVTMRPPRSGPVPKGAPDTWYCHGAAAHLDGRIAIRKALLEACLTYRYLEQLWYTDRALWRRCDTIEQVTDFESHAVFYNTRDAYRKQLSFLDKGERVVFENTPGAVAIEHDSNTKTRVVTAILDNADVHGAVVELTTDDIRPSGLRVVRVLLEQFPWLHGDHLWPFLGSARLRHPHRHYTFIDPPKGKIENCINPWPHAMA